MSAAVPRSFSSRPRPSPGGSRRGPELAEVLRELVDRVGRDRRRDGRSWNWSPPAALRISGSEPGEERRAQADQQEERGDDRQAQRPPRSRSSLRSSDPDRPSASTLAADEAAPSSSSARPTSSRKTSSRVGRTRSKEASRTPAATTSGRSRRRRGRVGDRHEIRSRRRPRVDVRRPTASPAGVPPAPRPPRPGPARARADRPAGRSGRAGRRAAPRSRAGRGRGSRPGRRSARRPTRTWVEKMTVASPRSSAISSRRSRRPSGSSELTGSSRISDAGRAMSAWAIPSRWRIPPE